MECKFDPAKLPRQLVLTASLGHPGHPLGDARRNGPQWFKSVDRNGDGYVSRLEFTGTPELFDKLDRDKDRFLSPEEVEKAEKPAPRSSGVARARASSSPNTLCRGYTSPLSVRDSVQKASPRPGARTTRPRTARRKPLSDSLR